MLPSEIITVILVSLVVIGFTAFCLILALKAFKERETGFGLVVLGMWVCFALICLGSYFESIGM
ncbi:hypothetical protein PMW_76 [Pseudomonas phage phiPMW]|uniref:Uncharacterized protein n=1 Tax=Pseudomonas phage phiPMW TaxID=1815582 RepID=A0A1S5R1B3_9CAUD|nr:hypothetical protein FDG97_gp076 [Pseudomonas phage phiPMW]ANA49201.1 hypothetical protein PMW_76 [Pseudomonas phage phiPMW]